MPPMSRHPFLCFCLALALLLNGLVVVHAAPGHAGLGMPAAQAVDIVEKAPCHDMEHMQDDLPPASDAHNDMSCCQGSLCNCACAFQLQAAVPGMMPGSLWQPVQTGSTGNRYRSIDPALILRPPIA